jgi:hypothetical protein
MTKHGRKKVGRNNPCPCGSGVKYKKCHGRGPVKPFAPPLEKIKAIMETHEAKEARRQSQQGLGKPIISAEFGGYRLTVAGNRLHYSKNHKTFIDFLGDYIRSVMGPEWGNSETAKPFETRHQILKWYDGICSLQRSTMRKPKGEIQDMQINGLVAAYYGLAYNLYLLQHNVELQAYLIRRLKQSDSFYAAYYETYVAAWFILAGFKLRLEDEQDPTKTHPEFIASRDGLSYSVEAKTRQPGKKHFDVGNQLYKGLCIEAHHPRVIFIDMNVGEDLDFEAFSKEALAAVRSREQKLKIQGNPAPPAHVFVTNQPYHLALDETRLHRVCLAAGFKVPDFGYGVKSSSFTETYKTRVKYAALNDVQKAMLTYSIPVTFDGEIPEFAFGKADRRFSIGERFEVGDNIFMTLESGIVVDSEQKAFLVLADDGEQRHIVTVQLSEAEITAYKSHPETFFGRITSTTGKIDDPMDLYEFFLSGYKNTPREKLIEFMNNSPDIIELKKMSDDELLYTYAERLTHGAISKRKTKKQNSTIG